MEPDESKQAPPPAASSTAQPAPEKTPAMAAEARLTAERKAWRKDRPEHFVAKPQTRPDSSANLFVWDIVIPGKPGSVWAPGLYPATMTFTADYPEKPPVIKFKPIKGQPLFHPNVYTDGGVCMSIINPEGSRHHYGSGGTWKPAISIKQVLLALQMFLDEATSRCGPAASHASLRLHIRFARASYLHLSVFCAFCCAQGGRARGGIQSLQQQQARVRQTRQAAGGGRRALLIALVSASRARGTEVRAWLCVPRMAPRLPRGREPLGTARDPRTRDTVATHAVECGRARVRRALGACTVTLIV